MTSKTRQRNGRQTSKQNGRTKNLIKIYTTPSLTHTIRVQRDLEFGLIIESDAILLDDVTGSVVGNFDALRNVFALNKLTQET